MPYIDNDGKYIKAGASLGVGLCCAGINDENDLAFAVVEVFDQSAMPTRTKYKCTIFFPEGFIAFINCNCPKTAASATLLAHPKKRAGSVDRRQVGRGRVG